MEQTLSDSPHNPISSPSDHDYPVVIEIQQAEKTAQGLFRPQASLKVTAVLRTSGLLLALPGEEVKNLLFLLTFLTPNGDCLPTVQQLAQAMHVSAAKAQARMQRLMQFRWQGEPLVIWLRRESGLHAYTPNPRLIAYEHLELHAPAEPQATPYQAAGRDAVIAYSRTHYGRSRHEVEDLINRQMGWTPPPPVADKAVDGGLGESSVDAAAANAAPPDAAPPDTPPALIEPEPQPSTGEHSEAAERDQVRRRLWNLGVNLEQADYLLNHYDLLRIQRQLHWLSYRKVRNPAGFLVAAIEDNYAAPAALWHHPVSTADHAQQDSAPETAQPQEPEATAPPAQGGDVPQGR